MFLKGHVINNSSTVNLGIILNEVKRRAVIVHVEKFASRVKHVQIVIIFSKNEADVPGVAYMAIFFLAG